MAVFLSSTCYNLVDLRAEVEQFFKDKQENVLLSDREEFPIPHGLHRHDVCVENVGKCDLFILVIDDRYGAPYHKDNTISITWAEYREAIKTRRQIRVFVRNAVFLERQTYKKNKDLGNKFEPCYTDDVRTFEFISEVQKDESGIWIQPFQNSPEVKRALQAMYDANNSPLNRIDPAQIDANKGIPLNALSGATATFITANYPLESKEISVDLLRDAINKIPVDFQILGKGTAHTPGLFISNEWQFTFPLNDAKSKSEAEIGVRPTALGHSVRDELQNALNILENANSSSAYFIDTVKRTPIYCKQFTFNKRSLIIGLYEESVNLLGKIQHLCMLENVLNKWQVCHDQSLDEFQNYAKLSDDSEILVEDDKVYFYFERVLQHLGTANNGLKEIQFSVFDVLDKALHIVQLHGHIRDNTVEGNIDVENPTYEKYKFIFEPKISHSKSVYRTPADYNINAPKNWRDKWEADNPDFYKSTFGNIKVCYYDEDVSQKWQGQKKGEVENEKYILSYYFAGPIIGFVQDSKKYFILLCPQGRYGGSWGIRSISSMKFLPNGMLYAQNGFEYYEINLANLHYKREPLEATKKLREGFSLYQRTIKKRKP